MSRLGKKIQICVGIFTFSLKLEKWSFHVADLPRTGKKYSEIIKAREGHAKVLFLFIKYAKFVGLSLPSRRRSLTHYYCQHRAHVNDVTEDTLLLSVTPLRIVVTLKLTHAFSLNRKVTHIRTAFLHLKATEILSC